MMALFLCKERMIDLGNQYRTADGNILGTSNTTGETRRLKCSDDGILQTQLTGSLANIPVGVKTQSPKFFSIPQRSPPNKSMQVSFN